METINFLITGVGGQGTVLASELVAKVGMAAGYDVKKSDILGLSVRGGGVVSHVRWGDEVYSPIVPEGRVDYLIAFEKLEGLRWLNQVKPDGKVLINQQKIFPIVVLSGAAKYPTDQDGDAVIRKTSPHYSPIPALDLALSLGNSKTLNVVLLGALSAMLTPQEGLWETVIQENVPAKAVNLNLKAFHTGRNWMKGK